MILLVLFRENFTLSILLINLDKKLQVFVSTLKQIFFWINVLHLEIVYMTVIEIK